MTLFFERQVGAMRLRDMTIVKFSPRSLSLGLQIVGGLLFGAGWAIIGYCPGTSIGALGEGRYHVIWPILGMLVGGLVFVFLYPFIQTYIRPIGSFGALTVPGILGINHWVVIAALAVGAFFLFRFFEKKGL